MKAQSAANTKGNQTAANANGRQAAADANVNQTAVSANKSAPKAAHIDPAAKDATLADPKAEAGAIEKIRASDPKAAEARLQRAEENYDVPQKRKLYANLGLETQESGERLKTAFNTQINRNSVVDGAKIAGDVLTGKMSIEDAAKTIFEHGEAAIAVKKKVGPGVEVGGTVKLETSKHGVKHVEIKGHDGDGSIDAHNENQDVGARLGGALYDAYDETIGKIMPEGGFSVSSFIETNLQAGAKVSKKGVQAGAWAEAKAVLARVEIFGQTPFGAVQGRLNVDGSSNEGVGQSPGGKAGISKRPTKFEPSAELRAVTGASKISNAPEQTLVQSLNAAGADADTAMAQQVQEKFEISQTGQLTVDLAGQVEMMEGVAAGEEFGTVTKPLLGKTGKLESQVNVFDQLGGKYNDVRDVTRFVNAIIEQNSGPGEAFEDVLPMTPEQLIALNSENGKVVTREVDGQTVQLISQQALRLPYSVGANDQFERDDVVEVGDDVVRIAGLD